MKVFLIGSLVLLSWASAFANVSMITCHVIEEFKHKDYDVKVEFLISDLESIDAKLIQHPQAENGEGAILVNPKSIKGTHTNMSYLNTQGGYLQVSNDRINLLGDNGQAFVELVLFRESGFSKGYVRIYGNGDQMYQELNCSVKY